MKNARAWRWALCCALAVLGRGAAQEPAPRVDRIALPVADLERSVPFYRDVLAFRVLEEREDFGPAVEHAYGVFGARVHTVLLALGDERLELCEFLAPRGGRAVPGDSRSNDRWFQHIAIVVRDLDEAYAHLRAHRVGHVSPGPQRLPDWNPAAGGIGAFYFVDPDQHPLEVLEFPPGKGAARWQREDALFLGIDHTAIVVEDTERSLGFYRDRLRLREVGHSENWGPEQERLNSVFGAHLRITTLRGASGPGVELLEYLAPRGGRPTPIDAHSNDLWVWRVVLEDPAVEASATSRSAPVGGEATLGWQLLQDPDGHTLQVSVGGNAGAK